MKVETTTPPAADVALLPCPFCGPSEKHPVKIFEERRFRSGLKNSWAVECTNCGAIVEANCDAENAADNWNRRSQSPGAARDTPVENIEAIYAEHRKIVAEWRSKLPGSHYPLYLAQLDPIASPLALLIKRAAGVGPMRSAEEWWAEIAGTGNVFKDRAVEL
jgi:hypothetical protein